MTTVRVQSKKKILRPTFTKQNSAFTSRAWKKHAKLSNHQYWISKQVLVIKIRQNEGSSALLSYNVSKVSRNSHLTF